MRASADSQPPTRVTYVQWTTHQRRRKPKPPIASAVWESYKTKIILLYILQRTTLDEVIRALEECGLSPSRRQLLAKLKDWEVRKHRHENQPGMTPNSLLRVQERRLDLSGLTMKASPDSYGDPGSPTLDAEFGAGCAKFLEGFDNGDELGFTYGESSRPSSFARGDSFRTFPQVPGEDDSTFMPLGRSHAGYQETSFSACEAVNLRMITDDMTGFSSAVDHWGASNGMESGPVDWSQIFEFPPYGIVLDSQ